MEMVKAAAVAAAAAAAAPLATGRRGSSGVGRGKQSSRKVMSVEDSDRGVRGGSRDLAMARPLGLLTLALDFVTAEAARKPPAADKAIFGLPMAMLEDFLDSQVSGWGGAMTIFTREFSASLACVLMVILTSFHMNEHLSSNSSGTKKHSDKRRHDWLAGTEKFVFVMWDLPI